MKTTTAHIGLGSNVGDKAGTLMSALRMISQIDGVSMLRISQFIKTSPVGGPADQPDYLNAAAAIETELSPYELRSALRDIETKLGRDRAAERRWGPRTCDLDILLMGQVVLGDEELTIPHARMHERTFVLRPLAQIAPDVVHPLLHKTVAELLAEAEGAQK